MRWQTVAVWAAMELVLRAGTAAGQSAPAQLSDLLQVAAVEATRQDMVEAQLADLISRFEGLLTDLASNPGVGTELSKTTGNLHDRLRVVREVRLDSARKAIGESLRAPATAARSLAEARQQIELAARELGSLLLQAGVSQACVVFAVELKDIVVEQEALRGAGGEAPVEAQKDLAGRVEKLLEDIRTTREFPSDALALVRLVRARKIVEGGRVVAEMRQAATELASRRAAAAGQQGKAVGVLRQGILKLRPDARLQELVRVRNLLREVIASQKELVPHLEWQPDVLGIKQEAVVRSLEPLEGVVYQIDPPLLAARKAGQESATALGSGRTDAARAAQDRLETALGNALFNLDVLIAKLAAPAETHKRMLQAAQRLRTVSGLRDRVYRIQEAAMKDGADMERLVATSAQLVKDIGGFSTALPSARKFSALRRPLRKAARALEESAERLRVKGAPEAMAAWQKVEQSLQEAGDAAKKDLGSLERLWLLRQAAADIERLRPVIEDLEGEQRDLHDIVATARKGKHTVLDHVGAQALLVRALEQVQESAALIREADLLKTSLDSARAAMKQAQAQLGEDQPEPALAAQKRSAAALREAATIAASVIRQIETIAMEMDAAAELSGIAAGLLARQIELRETTTDAPEADFPHLAGEQDILLAETAVLAELSVAPTAAAAFTTAREEMKGAIVQLKALRREPAVVRQKKAEDALRAGMVALDEYILSLLEVMIPGKPGLVGDPLEEAKNIMMKILFLAAEQKELRDLTQRTPDLALPNHVGRQMELHQRLLDLLSLRVFGPLGFVGKEHLEAAVRPMEQAAATLKASAKNDALAHQQMAEKELRMAFILNLKRIIDNLMPRIPALTPGTSPAELTPAGGGFNLGPMGDGWKNFGQFTVKGRAPPGGKASEWNSLTARERAALNENFARELPLEFRQMLKDYYEALSQ